MQNQIRLACISIQGNFKPKKVMTDYETGAIGATLSMIYAVVCIQKEN